MKESRLLFSLTFWGIFKGSKIFFHLVLSVFSKHPCPWPLNCCLLHVCGFGLMNGCFLSTHCKSQKPCHCVFIYLFWDCKAFFCDYKTFNFMVFMKYMKKLHGTMSKLLKQNMNMLRTERICPYTHIRSLKGPCNRPQKHLSAALACLCTTADWSENKEDIYERRHWGNQPAWKSGRTISLPCWKLWLIFLTATTRVSVFYNSAQHLPETYRVPKSLDPSKRRLAVR